MDVITVPKIYNPLVVYIFYCIALVHSQTRRHTIKYVYYNERINLLRLFIARNSDRFCVKSAIFPLYFYICLHILFSGKDIYDSTSE